MWSVPVSRRVVSFVELMVVVSMLTILFGLLMLLQRLASRGSG